MLNQKRGNWKTITSARRKRSCSVGPVLGYEIGPLDSWSVLPDGGLYISSFLMIAGRLEIFAFIIPFVPSFWREY